MDSSGRHPRLLLALLAVSCLVTAAALVAGLVRVGVAPEPGTAASTRPSPDVAADSGVARAADVLHAWDARRAEAWARGDLGLLRSLYVPGSRAGEHDAAMLRAWVRRDLHVRGMQTQLLRLRVLAGAADRLVLEVTDRVSGVAVASGRSPVALPADLPSRRVVVLVRAAGRWRVSTVRERRA